MDRIPPKRSLPRVPPPQEKRKPGQPTKYRPEYCSVVVELGREGKSMTQMAVAIGVDRDTLRDWGKSFPEFFRALKRAKECELEWWENVGQSALFADRFQQSAYIFQMKNRFREDYYDQQVITGLNGQPLTQAPPPLVINFFAQKRPGDDAKLIEAKPAIR